MPKERRLGPRPFSMHKPRSWSTIKRQAIQAEMDECVTLAEECGVAEASVEMCVASELFMHENKRAFFRAIKTPKAQLVWLQMHCKQRGLV